MVHTTMNRIHSTRMAGVRANNQWFKDYWYSVANHFEKQLFELESLQIGV